MTWKRVIKQMWELIKREGLGHKLPRDCAEWIDEHVTPVIRAEIATPKEIHDHFNSVTRGIARP